MTINEFLITSEEFYPPTGITGSVIIVSVITLTTITYLLSRKISRSQSISKSNVTFKMATEERLRKINYTTDGDLNSIYKMFPSQLWAKELVANFIFIDGTLDWTKDFPYNESVTAEDLALLLPPVYTLPLDLSKLILDVESFYLAALDLERRIQFTYSKVLELRGMITDFGMINRAIYQATVRDMDWARWNVLNEYRCLKRDLRRYCAEIRKMEAVIKLYDKSYIEKPRMSAEDEDIF